jgi:hypothetical protein
MVYGGKLFKRYDVKPGKKPPGNFEPANDVDSETGKQQGWLPVGDGPDDRWHREAWENQLGPAGKIPDGTYELCGPKVQSNPESEYVSGEVRDKHLLIRHGCYLFDCPRDFMGIKEFFAANNIEGIVWHHPDGRMVKIKGKDFGIKRPKRELEAAT